MNIQDLERALADINVQAFLRVIRERESNQNEDAYTIINGGAHFTDFARHPFGDLTTTNGGKAAGAYQFLPTTWAGLARQYGFADFSPHSQDLGAVALVAGRGALGDVLLGDFGHAIPKLRAEWTSLPGAAESSSGWTMEKAAAVFVAYGGKFSAQDAGEAPAHVSTAPTAAPIPADVATPSPTGARMPEILGTIAAAATVFNPIAGLGLGLLNSLIDAFTPLAKQKMQSALDKHGADPQVSAQLVDSVLAIAKTVTGKADPIEAVVEARGSPVAMQTIEAQSMDKLDELAPLLDKVAQFQKQEWDASEQSMDNAAARARVDSTWDMTKTLVYGALAFFGTLLLFVFFVAGWQVIVTPSHTPSTEVWAAITGLIGTAGGIVLTIIAFRFGANRSSGAKDELVAQMATRRPR